MFGFLKGKHKGEKVFYSMVSGKSIDLSEVDDEMFAGRVLGDGIAVEPKEDTFVAPCTGTVTTVTDTKHAIGLENEDGVQVLIHIGLDTVKLNGRGFDTYVEPGQKVKTGDPLVKVDRGMLREEGIPDVSMLIFVEPNGHELTKFYTEQAVEAGSSALVEYK
ncbi:PTS sugar transporter subunit IIA [Anaerostipes sp.]|uniref:PTS sugar transporter subunit IIA n=1 Tax=Anaerostipes sp. TaxID=1872530 RepID=UPI0025C6AA77|nr:PTS glucose transporter subunit IIA [Anaerostipes sp.]MBS7008979.1 PTS glucose transporter subunit IIA [Anaerostipes sp.]